MKTESRWYSETANAWIAEGEIKGEIRILFRILANRGIELTEEQRRRIDECMDPELVEAWADRALTVSTADELFA
ncbi:hypothetical protein Arub01_31250 [Actinomadura rubrobrunea]|uniref:DUF4351 domain-containing protein n=1 Tax=Actinomadura rubrobrunea TaxID=115335 RepID=A0A9W6PXP3_9ACTN|nr:hypothetical protein [Actinomadura rubrobrunea]GLW64881.1 hypothetical protein Arub01_31250 [Actinomadura rubrobrunea]